jgi:hypothetical protein
MEKYKLITDPKNIYYLSKEEFKSGKQGFIHFNLETGEISFKEKVKLFSKYKKD